MNKAFKSFSQFIFDILNKTKLVESKVGEIPIICWFDRFSGFITKDFVTESGLALTNSSGSTACKQRASRECPRDLTMRL